MLEIGCGPGVAAVLVCDRLTTGHLLAVDRSAVAVERTARRGAAHVAAGRLDVVRSGVEQLDLPQASLDAAFAVDVNLFWTTDAGPALDVLTRALRPGGRLHVLYGTGGPTSPDRVLGPVTSGLAEHGFATRIVTDEAGFGVTARVSEA